MGQGEIEARTTFSRLEVSRITEKVTGEMTELLNRPLEKVDQRSV
jgi:hypothetical protein